MNLKVAFAALAALTLAACAQTPIGSPSLTGAGAAQKGHGQPVAPAFKPTPGLSAADRQKLAIDLLTRGQPDQARAELNALLLDQPANATARKLLDQIDKDPRVLLGEINYAYKVKPGETLSALAQRFLGDPLMFYALARYNAIAVPEALEVGQTLAIPGTPKKASPRQPAPAAPAAPARDPARAAQLRSQGLVQLNRGAPARAAALLRQALSLDPGNALIQKDLDRAERLRRTVRK
jgi:Tfp pilus assembly protein PilF